MNFEITDLKSLWLLVLIIPALIFSILRGKRLSIALGTLYTDRSKDSPFLQNIKFRLRIRRFFWTIAWCSIVLSFSGIFFGRILIPVQKMGRAVSFVFDISYSMMASDIVVKNNKTSKDITRLEGATIYAQELLERLPNTAISAVIAKGDGIIAVPLTEDIHAVESLLPVLSPELMSSSGTSLGHGIDAAVRSFPVASSRSSAIVVFTDGDETDNRLEESLKRAVSYGIPVVFVGFGSTEGTSVLTGDGKTAVVSALQQKKLKELEDKFSENMIFRQQFFGARTSPVLYVDAIDIGSATRVLQVILGQTSAEDKDQVIIGYETELVLRYRFFLIIAILSFVLGFISTEIQFSKFQKTNKNKNINVLILFPFALMLFSGCSQTNTSAIKILEGQYYWFQKDYYKATKSFLNVIENSSITENHIMMSYGLIGLGTTYAVQNELASSLEKFNLIPQDASDDVLFASSYNKGCIAFSNRDYKKAALYFKEALLIDNTNIKAKINLELSTNQSKEQVNAQAGIQEMIPASQNKSDANVLENTLFSIIRENDQNRWKNQKAQPDFLTSDDY